MSTPATGAGVGATTLSVALPVVPSLVAEMVAVPGAIPMTLPLVLTAAIALLLDAQVTDRPDITAPFASRTDAMACRESPTAIDAAEIDTVTDLTVVMVGPMPPLSALPPHESSKQAAKTSSVRRRTTEPVLVEGRVAALPATSRRYPTYQRTGNASSDGRGEANEAPGVGRFVA